MTLLVFAFSAFTAVWVIHASFSRRTAGAPEVRADGEVVVRESYWLYAVAKLSFSLLFMGGSLWADIGAGWQEVALLLPYFALGVSGVTDLAFRRRHIFFVRARRVRVEGFTVLRGAFARGYDYSELRYAVEDRSGPRSAWHCAMFIYPDFEVSFYSSSDEREVTRRLSEIVVMLRMPPEPNQAPEPTTMAVTIRAPSSTARASHGRGSS